MPVLEKIVYTSEKQHLRPPAPEGDASIMEAIGILRQELEDLHNRFDQATEPVLVDSIIYEIQAVQLRYMYYLELCKERGIVSGEFSRIRGG